MSCDCPLSSCKEFGFTGRRADICSGRALTPEACETYRQHWRQAKAKEAGDVRYSDSPCIHRGEVLRQVECNVCGIRGKMAPVYACAVLIECTDRRTDYRQQEAICFGCERKKISP